MFAFVIAACDAFQYSNLPGNGWHVQTGFVTELSAYEYGARLLVACELVTPNTNKKAETIVREFQADLSPAAYFHVFPASTMPGSES